MPEPISRLDKMPSNSASNLFERASSKHVAVIGGGISGLVAALECAKLGFKVTVFEASDNFGGAVRSAELSPVSGDASGEGQSEAKSIRVDTGAESYATRGGHLAKLIDELALESEVTRPNPQGAWVSGPGFAAPLPTGSILGIPGNVWDPSVRKIIGWDGVARAYLDRLRPPLTIGVQHSLGDLVKSRMGKKVADYLVAPVVTGVYSAPISDIDVTVAAPGLSEAMTRTGSLSGGVSQLIDAREAEGASAKTAPGGAVAGLRGGMWRLVDALLKRLTDYEVTLLSQTRVAALLREASGDRDGWRLLAEGFEDDEFALFDGIVLATPQQAAAALLADVGVSLAALHPGPVVEVVSVLLEAPEFDAAPRGNGVLTVPGFAAAKAATHSNAKWPWLNDELLELFGPGHHLLRLSFGEQGIAPATEGLTESELLGLVLQQIEALFGVQPRPEQLLALVRERFDQSQPAAAIGHRGEIETVRKQIDELPALVAVGAWLAGTGLAQVVPDALKQADSLRTQLLWQGEKR